MILDMDHSPSFLEDNQSEGSIWPWVIALLALIGIMLLTAQVSKAIPAQVATNARNAISAENVPGVNLSVEGRDVILSGTLSPEVNKRRLVAAVNQAGGVRTVSDQLSVFDPELAAEERSSRFQAQLKEIDVSSLAFEPGSASLTQQSRPSLDALSQLLLNYPEQRIRVAGHTDNTGRPAVNLRISRERADAVAGYLISRGATTSQVIARGFGATRPIADNSTDVGRARNRRIEIIYIN